MLLSHVFKYIRLSPFSCVQSHKYTVCLRQINQQVFGRSKKSESRMSVDVFRQKKIYKAIVQDIFDASPSIKIIRLAVNEPDFSFKAGQWVDFFIPGIEEVTGYSITSGPYQITSNGTFDLAVKYAKYAPTNWIHTMCSEGSEIDVQVGGDFHYDPQEGSPEAKADLLLVGGGVGANPIVSILSHYHHLKNLKDSATRPGRVQLLYSSKTEKELIFKEAFEAMEKCQPGINCHYFVSKPGYIPIDPKVKCGRITENDVKNCLNNLQSKNTFCYICGPSSMTDDVVNLLIKLGIQEKYIKYEKWW